jgi:hypothetical protein
MAHAHGEKRGSVTGRTGPNETDAMGKGREGGKGSEEEDTSFSHVVLQSEHVVVQLLHGFVCEGQCAVLFI